MHDLMSVFRVVWQDCCQSPDLTFSSASDVHFTVTESLNQCRVYACALQSSNTIFCLSQFLQLANCCAQANTSCQGSLEVFPSTFKVFEQIQICVLIEHF